MNQYSVPLSSSNSKFSQVSTVDTEIRVTWQGKMFLTLDLDWAHDDVLLYAIQLVELANVSATWLVTHDTPLLERLRSNPLFELGIHPNFNPLLEGTAPEGETARSVIERLMEIVPEATAVRSHSTVHSSRILDHFVNCGLTHDLNSMIPASLASHASPWKLSNGITRLPYWWADDVALQSEPKRVLTDFLPSEQIGQGVNCINFHPIHVYLNTSSQAQYEGARPDFQDPTKLSSHRSEGNGIHTDLGNVLRLADQP